MRQQPLARERLQQPVESRLGIARLRPQLGELHRPPEARDQIEHGHRLADGPVAGLLSDPLSRLLRVHPASPFRAIRPAAAALDC